MQPADGAEVLHNGVRVQSLDVAAQRRRRQSRRGAPACCRERRASASSKSTTAAAATSLRRRSSPPARACTDRATAMRSESMRFAFALPRPRGRTRRISLSPRAHRAGRGRRGRCRRAVVHFHGDVGQPAHRSRLRRTCECHGGLPAVRFGDRVLLRPGTYRIRAELAGYTPAELQIKVTEAPNQQFALTLAKLPGHPAHRRARSRARDRGRQGSGQRARRIRARGRASQRRDRARSAISRSAPTSRSRASARRRRSSRSSCRAGAT